MAVLCTILILILYAAVASTEECRKISVSGKCRDVEMTGVYEMMNHREDGRPVYVRNAQRLSYYMYYVDQEDGGEWHIASDRKHFYGLRAINTDSAEVPQDIKGPWKIHYLQRWQELELTIRCEFEEQEDIDQHDKHTTWLLVGLVTVPFTFTAALAFCAVRLYRKTLHLKKTNKHAGSTRSEAPPPAYCINEHAAPLPGKTSQEGMASSNPALSGPSTSHDNSQET